MFLLGHVGFTWGAALLLADTSRWRPSSAGIDYRLVLLGSMLPDLIDKPLGLFILRKQLSNPRTLAHSLLFSLLVALAALGRREKAGSALGSVALGSLTHLVLDRMWEQTDTLLWPLKGLSFERRDISDWLGQTLETLLSDPYVYLSEVVGAAVIVTLVADLKARQSLPEFLRSGRMSARSHRPRSRV